MRHGDNKLQSFPTIVEYSSARLFSMILPSAILGNVCNICVIYMYVCMYVCMQCLNWEKLSRGAQSNDLKTAFQRYNYSTQTRRGPTSHASGYKKIQKHR